MSHDQKKGTTHLPDHPSSHVYRVTLEDLARQLIATAGMDPLRFGVDCCSIKIEDGMTAGGKTLEITIPTDPIAEEG